LGIEGGQRRRKYVYGDSQAEVLARFEKVRSEVARGLPAPDERVTVEAFLEDWLETTVKPNLRPNTYTGYALNVRKHIVPVIGSLRLARLSQRDVERLLTRKRTDGLSPRTIQYIHATLRAALAKAARWDMVGRNVAALVSGPTVTRKPIEPLTTVQVREFLEGVKDDRLGALYVIAFTLGMRQGEILGLRWQDVNLDDGTLRVAQTLQRIPGGRAFGPPKSERSNRRLVLPAFARDSLKAHRTRQLEERLAAGSAWNDSGLVFTTSIGTPIDSRSLTRQFQAHLERLKLPRQRFHDARHACASLLLELGEPMRTIMEVLGHSQIALTADTYSHLSIEMKRGAATKMESLFGAGRNLQAVK
jgi:integrase